MAAGSNGTCRAAPDFEVDARVPDLMQDQRTLARHLTATGVPGLDYTQFEGNAVRAIAAHGNLNTRDWARPLAQGYVVVTQAANPSARPEDLRGFQESAGNLLTDLAVRGQRDAVASFGATIAGDALRSFKVSGDAAGSVVELAQNVVKDGLGSVATTLIAGAGAALGPLTGGLSMVAGGLVSFGLSKFFGGGDKPGPPLPAAKIRTPLRRPTTQVELAEVWEEVFTTVVRWRKMPLPRAANGLNHFFLPEGYTALTRRTKNLSWCVNPIDTVNGFGPYGSGPSAPLPRWWEWVGYPVPFMVDGQAYYRFSHDLLARWVGYNPNLSLVTEKLIKDGFSTSDFGRVDRVHMNLYQPWFSEMGWAEWVVAGMAQPLKANYIKAADHARAVGITKHNWFYAEPELPGLLNYWNNKFKAEGHHGTNSLLRLAEKRSTDPIGAMAFVAATLRHVLAAGFEFSKQQSFVDSTTQALKIDAENWQRQTLTTIMSLLTSGGKANDANRLWEEMQRGARDREADEKVHRAGFPVWIIPTALAAAALGAVLTRRR